LAPPSPALSLLARRVSHDLHPPVCAGVALNAQQVHPEQAELLLVAAGAAAPPAGAGATQRTAAGAMLACWQIARDENHASGYDPGVIEHLHSTEIVAV